LFNPPNVRVCQSIIPQRLTGCELRFDPGQLEHQPLSFRVTGGGFDRGVLALGFVFQALAGVAVVDWVRAVFNAFAGVFIVKRAERVDDWIT
jgi:hypothetical protein